MTSQSQEKTRYKLLLKDVDVTCEYTHSFIVMAGGNDERSPLLQNGGEHGHTDDDVEVSRILHVRNQF